MIDWDALHDEIWLMWQDPMASAHDAVALFRAAYEKAHA